ncbi:MAG: STAS/SEC14 domain-containing protein [Myxococcota bacterium]|nr:STAS/SEC14 domain-containing protein [Myxococcota bacterium]
MGATAVDDSQWPLVRIRIDGEQSDHDVEELLARFGELASRGEPYLAYAQVGEYKPDFGHVKRVAAWTLENRAIVKQGVAAAVLVIPSDLFRLMLSAFALVTPVPCPFLVTRDEEEAIEWLRGQAEELGIPYSPV